MLRAELAPIRARVDGLPLIGEAISTLQHDMRLIRAAVNDLARTNITAGEVEAMHTDIDRALSELRDLAARVMTLETQRDEK
jgi:hypothetical protein